VHRPVLVVSRDAVLPTLRRPLAAALLVERIVRLGAERMSAVCDALTFAVECDAG